MAIMGTNMISNDSPPPPPGACNMSTASMFKMSARMESAKNRPRPLAPRELLFHHGVWIDFGRVASAFRLASGEAIRRGHGFGRDQTREETGPFPKSNRMPYPPHGVKVETQVVVGIQDLRQHFVGGIKMTQIGPRVAPAHPTAAIRVERALVLG